MKTVNETTTISETTEHINTVRNVLYSLIAELNIRANDHDRSKLHSPELEIFASTQGELEKVEYGTPEYDQLKDKVKPAIEHHYQNNRHHPEHFEGGVNDMNLVDIIEMFADWVAATKRTKNGNIFTSIEKNSIRFKMDEQLKLIFLNTAKDFSE
jgi:hypothetical protein